MTEKINRTQAAILWTLSVMRKATSCLKSLSASARASRKVMKDYNKCIDTLEKFQVYPWTLPPPVYAGCSALENSIFVMTSTEDEARKLVNDARQWTLEYTKTHPVNFLDTYNKKLRETIEALTMGEDS